ncbi:MAG: TraR/DksA family transcriptional regulator [Paracoccaceae bacterium]
MTSNSDYKTRLVARRDQLDRRLHSIEGELDAPAPADWEERATEREGDEVLESMGLSAQQEMRMILAALDRIETGEFGFCTKCGSKIAEARLQIVPATPFCATCAT